MMDYITVNVHDRQNNPSNNDVRRIFGQVTPPPGTENLAGDPIAALGKLFGILISIFLTIAGLFLVIYMLWGAFDWIISGGDKERVAKAQAKITNAVIGMILIFVVLAVWGLLTGDILGIIKNTPDGWQFKVPTL